jgi:4-amino-4-deoxy-L-arabinose transferase-like glycosyltransferase
MKKDKKTLMVWLGLVLVVAIVLRVVLFTVYPAVSYSDTASYRRSAEAVLGGFKQYDGTRTPGYPAFMALLGPDRAVYAAQLFLGLLITLVWFYLGWKASGSPILGSLMGLAHTLNPGQLFFEANLLTETLSTFWLMLALLGAFIWLERPKKRSVWLGLGIGLAAALAVLTRPVFIFMPVWLAVVLAFSFRDKKLQVDWRSLVGVLLPGVLLVGGWMGWIQQQYHMFSLTTMTGYHLIQHTGYYFEDVPDEYAGLRDVYLAYREARMAERGTQGNTIWEAIPAMQEVSGLSFYDLSRTLQKISVELILTHPWEYLARVLRGWWLFWRAPVYWDPAAVASPMLTSGLGTLILGLRGFLFGANLFFVVTSLVALVFRSLRKFWRLSAFHWLLAGSVWATSAASSLLDHGDNPRFLVPLQSVVVFWVLWLGYTSLTAWRERRGKGSGDGGPLPSGGEEAERAGH